MAATGPATRRPLHLRLPPGPRRSPRRLQRRAPCRRRAQPLPPGRGRLRAVRKGRRCRPGLHARQPRLPRRLGGVRRPGTIHQPRCQRAPGGGPGRSPGRHRGPRPRRPDERRGPLPGLPAAAQRQHAGLLGSTHRGPGTRAIRHLRHRRGVLGPGPAALELPGRRMGRSGPGGGPLPRRGPRPPRRPGHPLSRSLGRLWDGRAGTGAPRRRPHRICPGPGRVLQRSAPGGVAADR